ncbi:rhodanese-like domain-containing protein [Rhodopila sp.]|uniref:rhodanese-like domain-containing protein n=1 Tax=Rhodopila sp. TaxID=2480087 RepID=UPI002BCAB5D7|nr:rhodanese-like domain-containing protein [Rhodopila sp.]HVZ10539.1 rhodanese-like domain-containing protein [Rhodopila sp.]
MFWKRGPAADAAFMQALTPQQLRDVMAQGQVVLVDVREPPEHAAEHMEHIRGSLLNPLSRFDPAALPVADKQVVLYCRSGVRSPKALARCRTARSPVTAHLAGGYSHGCRPAFPSFRNGI